MAFAFEVVLRIQIDFDPVGDVVHLGGDDNAASAKKAERQRPIDPSLAREDKKDDKSCENDRHCAVVRFDQDQSNGDRKFSEHLQKSAQVHRVFALERSPG